MGVLNPKSKIMPVLKLVYAEKGLMVVYPLSEYSQIGKIKKAWKFKYGKLYDRCKIVYEGEQLFPKLRKVRNIATGEVYDSVEDAATKLFMSNNGVRNQCRKFYKGI